MDFYLNLRGTSIWNVPSAFMKTAMCFHLTSFYFHLTSDASISLAFNFHLEVIWKRNGLFWKLNRSKMEISILFPFCFHPFTK